MATTLQPGDRLNRAEFHRRYVQSPAWLQAELVDGIVQFRPKRVTATHAHANAHIAGWLGYYEAQTPGLSGAIRPTLLIDDTSELQPDAVLRFEARSFAACRVNHDGFLTGTPEFIAEVIEGSKYELTEKPAIYRRNGVKEYIVWRLLDKTIDWFKLEAGEFVRQQLNEGLYKSTVFPGLWLDAAALLAGQPAKVLAVLQQGLATAEHATFITNLEAARR